MSDLETSLKEYNDNLALANINLDDVPVKVRAGKESQKRDALSNVEDFRDRYGAALRKAAFGLALSGPGSEEFIRVAKEEADVLVVDGSELYKRIADRVAPSMGTNREFGVSQYSAVITELRAIAQELNVYSMPSPKWTEPVNVGDDVGLLKHITSMVDSGVGLDLAALYITRQILTAGLAAGANKTTVPVIVTGLGDKAAEMLPKLFHEGRSLLVDAPKDVTKEFVLDTFTKVKKQIKTTKKN